MSQKEKISNGVKNSIPYGHQLIDKNDIKAVTEVLEGEWLTQGPKVKEFENDLVDYCSAKYAVAVNNGTSALMLAYMAAGIKKGDEVLTTPLTFAATSNCLVHLGAKPVFCDIKEDTLNINPEEIAKKISTRTKAIVVVDFAGHPCEMDEIKEIAQEHNLLLIEDAAHSLGSLYKGRKVGSLADLTTLSFHPVKLITSVTYETPVLIRKDGNVKIVKIGALMDFMIDNYWEPDGYECLAFNKEGEISWQKIKAFIKHETHTEILKVHLEKGREVEITKSHSVFTVENNEIKKVPGRNLKVGDYLVVPKKLPIPNNFVNEIDMLDYIGEENVKYNQEQIMLKMSKRGSGGGKRIARKIKINEAFCKLLGYFIAEGGYNYNADRGGGGLQFTFSFQEKDSYVKEVKELFNSFWPNFKVTIILNKAKHKCTVLCGGFLHAKLFRSLGCGDNVYSKAIPDVIWHVDTQRKLAFVEGLMNGDGHRRVVSGSQSQKLKVASENLANGLHYLLLTLGIQSRLEQGEYYSKKGKLCHFYSCEILGLGSQVTAKENSIPTKFLSLNDMSSWVQKGRIRHKKSITVESVKKWLNVGMVNCPAFLLKDIALLKVKKITRRQLHSFVYDFEVEGLQNFIGGYGAICLHNTGEGGMILTNRKDFYEKMKKLRHHGIEKKPAKGGWYYEIGEPGFNFRLTDFQAALGMGQLKKADQFIAKRREIAAKYAEAFKSIEEMLIPKEKKYAKVAWHIYPVQFRLDRLKTSRKELFEALKEQGIGVQVHYMPLHLHPFYQKKFGYKKGDFPVAERYYQRTLTLPLFPAMTNGQAQKVISIVKKTICK